MELKISEVGLLETPLTPVTEFCMEKGQEQNGGCRHMVTTQCVSAVHKQRSPWELQKTVRAKGPILAHHLVFENKYLWEHRLPHSCTCGVWKLSHYNRRVKQSTVRFTK